MRLLFSLILITTFLISKSTFSNPQPTFDNPRKLSIRLYVSNTKVVNHILNTIYNILKEYPPESLKVAVIAYGPGMRAIKKDYNKKLLIRMKSLMEYDVEFIGCKNTMETMGWKEKDFIDGVEYVQAGIVEAIEREVDNWVGITPY